MKGYTAKEVGKMLDLTVAQVRSLARAGFLDPERGPRGEYRFSFQDLVLLRTAKGLVASRVPPRKVRNVLRKLKERLPAGRPLSGLQISAAGDRVVVRSGETIWNPQSGQTYLNFDVAELAERAAPHTARVFEEAEASEIDLEPEEWYSLGLEIEPAAPEHAREAYRRTLELDPEHVDARVNLGRLLQEDGLLRAAERHYKLALSLRPANVTAWFNLGVCLEDQKRHRDAVDAYRSAIRVDGQFADVYFNLSRVLEEIGDVRGALRCLKIYRTLRGQQP